ncbi:glycerol-3-phosphate 1-O-acyltransferase PlsB [Candidatus Schmidhempelia bombi]|uniref:Glycerol-3-phosphate acyltransferase n=1 Tax=Candidatus Schmidhempelia bombi str. Bimp TaxID=1387197 RepID=A0AB94IFC2_9GAMM|nr:glycerol-3-phosphate 1-O-acyltransferase PlsB [Candidatus Schmidhempelia bombi]TEA28210.1 glycerol-3-phosphate 1-O-acyltransferase PlsB [Candidatus Schmidhempelia bombi str. Bimp]
MLQWSMSWWTKTYYHLINIPVRIFVKSKAIPTDPIAELNIDLSQPILYVLPYNSKIDLMVLRQLTKKFNLPDPLKGITIDNHTYPAFVFIDKGPGIFASARQERYTQTILSDYFIAHQKHHSLNIQMLPVSVMFHRKPDKEGKKKLSLQVLGCAHKLVRMVFSGGNCYTQFSHILPFRSIINDEQNIQVLAHKMARVARIHFAKLRTAAVGPKLPNRSAMLKKLLKSQALSEAITEEAKSKDISLEKAQNNALEMLNEIAANFTYSMLRVTDWVLTWAWNRLYQGLQIRNADPIRELAQKGHEIVYAPCHRSHMDYLLLSYVLYRQGLVPPHIAAGINLNFWPAGPIFRRLGAFFIRRSFRGNKLYTAVFREYLAELFIRGYSVEYFIEGGRSRTGRLLNPKTGMLMMTIQTLLRGDPRPITIVPVYIGYEHVLEVATYANELRGAAKKQESLWQTLKAFCKLKKLGYGYVNFGEPIQLNQFLSHQVPEWRDSINATEPQRPNWLTPTTNVLATELMQKINRSAVVNAMNLCSTILLDSYHHALTKKVLLEQMNYTLALLRAVPYDKQISLPTEDAERLFEHARQMGKFTITVDDVGEMISLTQEQAVLMTYYRNNIQHLFIIPSLIARIIDRYNVIERNKVIAFIHQIFPMIKAELFLYHTEEELESYVNQLIDQLVTLSLIKEENQTLSAVIGKTVTIKLLAASADETLQRYAVAFSLLHKDPTMSRGMLEKESRRIAERLSILYGINAPEFFDKGVFATLTNTLKEQGYLSDNPSEVEAKIAEMCGILQPLIANDVMQTILEIGN